MSYHRTTAALGALVSRDGRLTSTLSIPTVQTSILSLPSGPSSAEQRYLASLPQCLIGEPKVTVLADGTVVRDHRGQSKGVRYTSRDGFSQVCLDQAAALAQHRRDVIDKKNGVPMPFLVGGGPAKHERDVLDGRLINDDYLRLLLRAQANGKGQVRATEFKVIWRDRSALAKKLESMFKVDMSRPAGPAAVNRPNTGPGPLGIPYLKSRLWFARHLEKRLPKHKQENLDNPEVAKVFLASLAHEYGSKIIPERAAHPGPVRDHRPSQCQQVGLPPHLVPCCVQALRKMGIEEYTKKLTKGDPEVMLCIQSVEQAEQAAAAAQQAGKKKRTLFLAAGAVGALVVGAALLKKRKKKS
jgi:hypothetical protein